MVDASSKDGTLFPWVFVHPLSSAGSGPAPRIQTSPYKGDDVRQSGTRHYTCLTETQARADPEQPRVFCLPLFYHSAMA
jgi:hypothetical protein